jgi:apolipoprotein N-acyltransferase
MGFVLDRRRVMLGVIAVVLTAMLLWFGAGLNPLWPLVWLAPIPVLVFALSDTWQAAAVVAVLAWFLGELNLFSYLVMLQTPASVWVPIFGVGALMFGLAVLLFRALARRGAWWSAVLAFPAAWVSWEYVVSLASPHGTAMNLAYTQLKFVPFLQVASVTGPWGMSFLMFVFAAAMAVGLFLREREPRRAAAIAGLCAGVIVMVLACGAMRMAMPPARDQVRVGLVASDLPEDAGVADASAAMRLGQQAYAAQVKQLADRGAKVIVLPEGLWTVSAETVRPVDEMFQSIADGSNVTIVVGVAYDGGTRQFDEARVYAPNVLVRSYDKHHLLPPFESMFTPGRSLLTWQTGSGMQGVAICKDMDFTGLSRKYGEAGTGLMLVPAGDFSVDRFWHGHMAVMRAVEDGFSLVRAARKGYLTVTDDRGRVLAETRSDSAPFATLVAAVPAVHDTTLYGLWGNWFAWVALVALGLMLAQVLRLRGSGEL